VLWFEGDWCANSNPPALNNWWNKEDGEDLYNYLIGLDSTMIINERVKRDFGLGDFNCPEQEVPDALLSRQWETCQTMNWAWGCNEADENSYKPASTLIRELVKVVSRDGNYLLNIGPKGDGTVTPGAVSILESFSDWMANCSPSFYSTT
jgi:alpha-L-fucosidase